MDAAPKKYNTVYKITNNANKKTYVGVHATDDPDDSYLGSGTYITRATKKHGKEKFTKEILSTHDTYEEALAEEARIVDEDFVKRRDTYNMRIGGGGSGASKSGKTLSDETRAKMSASHKGKTLSDETKARMSASSKGKSKSAEHRANNAAAQKGHLVSDEAKAKMSASSKGKTHSEESKARMVAAAKNRPKKTCPHCGIIIVQSHYTRYHGDKCKQAP